MDRSGNSASHSPWIVRQVALETKAQRSLRIALETQHNAHYGSRWKLNTTLTTDRVVGGNSVLQRICRNSHRFILRSKYLWGWL
ncbi:hypothetical protein LEP1GSC170_3547 [Leptospira interrogans serovar Bataviae str. HAI135]|nr:hypothetical protein LEP1GSC170_3547 [Leptospira interrogans serovar Bataviae str. HAI135]